MRASLSRLVLPWSIGLGLAVSVLCLLLSAALGLALRDTAARAAARETASIADGLAGRIEAGLAAVDLVLREAVAQARTGPHLSLDHAPIAAEIGFVNVLNADGDVIADTRPGASRPANFAGRDYFQAHVKSPSDGLAIGRPFATAPLRNPAIPVSRRLTGLPDAAGGPAFAGVAVVGLRLSWLRDVLDRPSAEPALPIAIRRDDGLVLMRAPYDLDAIGRGGGEPAWRAWQRDGTPIVAMEGEGTRVFRRLTNAPLVLELTVPAVPIAAWLWAPLLVLVPVLCGLGFAGLALSEVRNGAGIAAAADAANDERMRTMATMSHELRTPLTGILGQAELLRDEGGLDARQAARLARLCEAGALMRGIVDRVIDMTRPEDHDGKLTRAPVDLDALVRTCRGMVEWEAQKKGLHLTSHVAPGAPRCPVLAGDAVRQVLGNLLMNAVKFTPMGKVELRAMGDAHCLRFEVSDTGPGIPASKRDRLFRAYDRLDVTSAAAAGSGLGLSIAERLIRRMHGRVGQTGNPGGGSIFWVEIPIEPAATSDIPRPEAQPAQTMETCESFHLLLADDDALSRSIAADFLRAAGHSVVEAEDGAALAEAAGLCDFDAILTDVRMPNLDGLAAIARVRRLPGRRGQIPIVLVTADAEVARGDAWRRSGANLHLTKPYRRWELLAAVAAAARLLPVSGVLAPDVLAPGVLASGVLEAGVMESAMPEQGMRAAGGPMAEAAGPAASPPRDREPPRISPFLRMGGGASVADRPDGSLAEAALARIEVLMMLLDRPDAGGDPIVQDTAHDLTGTAGMMGLTGLADALRRFNAGEDDAAAGLKAACADVVRLLRRPPVPLVAPLAPCPASSLAADRAA